MEPTGARIGAAALVMALAACGSSSKPSAGPTATKSSKAAATTTTVANAAADKTAANALLLVQTDLPEGWIGSQSNSDPSDAADNQKLAACVGATDPAKQTVDVSGSDFDKGNAEVSSEVAFAPNRDAFVQDLRALRSSKFESCVKTLFDTQLQAEMAKDSPGVNVSDLTLTSLSTPTYGEGSVGLRLSVKVTGPTGPTIQLYVDEIEFGQGRAEVSLTFSDQGAPFDTLLERMLVGKAVAKLKTSAA